MQCPTFGPTSTTPEAPSFYHFYSIACAVPWTPTIFNGKCSIDEFGLNNISFLNFNSALYRPHIQPGGIMGIDYTPQLNMALNPTVTSHCPSVGNTLLSFQFKQLLLY